LPDGGDSKGNRPKCWQRDHRGRWTARGVKKKKKTLRKGKPIITETEIIIDPPILFPFRESTGKRPWLPRGKETNVLYSYKNRLAKYKKLSDAEIKGRKPRSTYLATTEK